MAADFDYDPEELVSFEGHDISLRTAVHRYLEARVHPDPLVDLVALRDPGKEPQILEEEHFEALLKEPAFSESATSGN
ncbi:hypothetical protein ACMDCR_11630 [Labrys okinawensis]|uniref:hypothetical protein n=1 Tax=Labrys okinawensis TaxID=346911 RepID=UPI0039BD0D9A